MGQSCGLLHQQPNIYLYLLPQNLEENIMKVLKLYKDNIIYVCIHFTVSNACTIKVLVHYLLCAIIGIVDPLDGTGTRALIQRASWLHTLIWVCRQYLSLVNMLGYVHIHPDIRSTSVLMYISWHVQYFRYAQIHTYTGLAWTLDLHFALVNCMNQGIQIVCGYHEFITD